MEKELTAQDQFERMRSEYPGFILIQNLPWLLMWHGQLKPLAKAYTIQILYSAVNLRCAGIDSRKVHVEVIEPILARRAAAPDKAIPHIFSSVSMPSRPRLCLHRREDWDPSMYIADSIVPWAAEWLVAYEGWRATGTWYAGGHNTEREELEPNRRRNR
jgi:hypothetical protein